MYYIINTLMNMSGAQFIGLIILLSILLSGIVAIFKAIFSYRINCASGTHNFEEVTDREGNYIKHVCTSCGRVIEK